MLARPQVAVSHGPRQVRSLSCNNLIYAARIDVCLPIASILALYLCRTAAAPAFADVRNWPNMGPPTGLSFLLGQFKLGDGRTAVMLQNQDDRVVAIPNVTIASHLVAKHCCVVSPQVGASHHACAHRLCRVISVMHGFIDGFMHGFILRGLTTGWS